MHAWQNSSNDINIIAARVACPVRHSVGHIFVSSISQLRCPVYIKHLKLYKVFNTMCSWNINNELSALTVCLTATVFSQALGGWT